MTDRVMSEKYQYYHKRGDTFILKQNGEIAGGVLMLILGGFIFYCDMMSETEIYILCFALLMIICGIAYIIKRKVFNVSERIFTVSYGGFFRKTYRFNQFQKFVVREEIVRQRYSGMGVRIVFKKNSQLPDMLLRTFWDKDSVESFVDETKRIMGKK